MEPNQGSSELLSGNISNSCTSVSSGARVSMNKPAVPPKPDKVSQASRPRSEHSAQSFVAENGDVSSRRQSAADILDPAVIKNSTKTLQSPRPHKSPAPPIPVVTRADENGRPDQLTKSTESIQIHSGFNQTPPLRNGIVVQPFKSTPDLKESNSTLKSDYDNEKSIAVIDVSSSHVGNKSLESIIDIAPSDTPMKKHDNESVFSLNFQPKPQLETETKVQYYWRRFCEVLFSIATFCIKCIGPV